MQVTAVPISDPVASPCRSRAPTSASMVGAAAHIADVAANTTVVTR